MFPQFPVSIPFIAGQWSLLGRIGMIPLAPAGFNPLHCGAVVASQLLSELESTADGFNPLHCGAVVASRARRMAGGGGGGSFNPLHCGAVVASPRSRRRSGGVGDRFQSPSLRGSGRFAWTLVEEADAASGFNPLHCGAVVASPGSPPRRKRKKSGFNPLHCGAVVASGREDNHDHD